MTCANSDTNSTTKYPTEERQYSIRKLLLYFMLFMICFLLLAVVGILDDVENIKLTMLNLFDQDVTMANVSLSNDVLLDERISELHRPWTEK